jgi:UDP-N-acetylmuramoylalanine--D-glutamate ligase
VSGVVAGERLDLAGLTVDGLRGRRVAVLGFARSGLAVARFLADAGARVTVYDVRPRDELAGRVEALEGRAVDLRLGPRVDPGSVLAGQDMVVTSPSVSSSFPTTEPRLRSALATVEAEARVPVVSEVDLFLRLCPAITVGVTGTKGKTTTASLVAAVLAAGPRRTWLGGNIGVPLIERVVEMHPGELVVVELSELQLPTLSRGTDVAVFTNVTADHLDRHGSVGAYRSVKARLAELTRARHGLLVLNDDDPFVAALARPGDRVVRYHRTSPAAGGIGVADGWVRAGDVAILPLAEIPLPGAHNLSNVLAAVAVGRHFEIPGEEIRRAVAEFPGVEHRLETVATVGGLRFVNDSQGTQPDAVMAALRAFERPIVLIAGGREKGLDLSGLAAVVAERAEGVVLMGESADSFAHLFAAAGVARMQRADSMDEAVRMAEGMARAAPRGTAGLATVLLSPAAASFDMFEDYAARGRAFKDAVARLLARPLP